MSWKNLLILLMAGAIICLLAKPQCNKKDSAAVPVIPVKEQVKTVQKMEDFYKPKYDSLNRADSIRKLKIKALTGDLDDARERYSTVIKLLKKTNADMSEENDYDRGSKFLIQQEAAQLELIAAEKDRKCDSLITISNDRANWKDTVIALKDSQYSSLRRSFDLAMIQQSKLAADNLQLKKEITRHKIGKGIWKAAAIVAGVFLLKDK